MCSVGVETGPGISMEDGRRDKGDPRYVLGVCRKFTESVSYPEVENLSF